MASQKWTRSMSWLNLPKKIKKLHSENLLAVSVDFEKYVCTDSTIVMKMIREMWFNGELDLDNSNIEHSHDYVMSLKHWKSDLWTIYEVLVNLPGFAPIQVFSYESYYDNRIKVLKSEWGLEFPWAFFRFYNILQEQAPEVTHFYDRVRRMSNLSVELSTWKPLSFRRNRVDVAIDLKLPIDQKWEYEYIIPSKNSKRVVHHYNYRADLWGWQSFGYLPRGVNRWIGIRVYNKSLDIISKKKQSWYPEIDPVNDVVTRVEIVYYSPYAENDDQKILESAKSAILWEGQHNLHYVNPQSVYSPLSAHTYFSRYAKNHWKQLSDILFDVTDIENKKI